MTCVTTCWKLEPTYCCYCCNGSGTPKRDPIIIIMTGTGAIGLFWLLFGEARKRPPSTLRLRGEGWLAGWVVACLLGRILVFFGLYVCVCVCVCVCLKLWEGRSWSF
jgi:hypothetical protein